MHWVIQNNLFREENYQVIYDTLTRVGIPYTEVTVVPFSHELIPEVSNDGPIMMYGSCLLIKIAQKRGWVPGAITNDNFQHSAWVEHWGTELLNHDAKVMKLDEAEYEGICFVRPAYDLKAFSGQIVEGKRFKFWREKHLQTHIGLKLDEEIVVAPLKIITQETRFFVVNGKIISGSIYRIGRQTIYRAEYSQAAGTYAEAMIAQWQPARAFVIDVAELEDGSHKVIEINCINSSGFYACDISKIIQALNNLAD